MDFKTRLRRYYEVRCPSKCSDVDKLVIKYKNKEKDLFRQLTFKYGPEPKLTNADKTAIQNRNPKSQKQAPISKETIDVNEWMNNMLTNEDKQLLDEIDKFTGKNLPKYILDKI